MTKVMKAIKSGDGNSSNGKKNGSEETSSTKVVPYTSGGESDSSSQVKTLQGSNSDDASSDAVASTANNEETKEETKEEPKEETKADQVEDDPQEGKWMI